MADFDFNANDYDPNAGGFDAVPTGCYRVQIIGSEIKENRKQTGDLLVFELEILEEGEYQGQRVWDRLNINHQQANTAERARQRLSLICHCVGQLRLDKTEDLHERPLLADLVYQGERVENGTKYGPSNRVTKYHPDNEGGGGGPNAAVKAEAEPAPRANGPVKAPRPPVGGSGKTGAPVATAGTAGTTGGSGTGTSGMPWRRKGPA